MAIFHVIGSSLIDPDEIVSKKASGELTSPTQALKFSNSTVQLEALQTLQTGVNGNFSPIGIGQPLSVEIATVYTGEYSKGFLGGKKDAVVVSGVKNSQTYGAASRAINIKATKVEEKTFLQFDAFNDGTAIVYYSPAMDADGMAVSFEIMFDNFDTTLFDTVSTLLTSAAGVPIFLPAASYLLGASQLINIGSKLGNTLFAGTPKLKDTLPIQFNSPIIPDTESTEFVICNDGDKRINKFTDRISIRRANYKVKIG
jgi:hypothetical protein